MLECLTRVAIVGHEEVPFLSIIACELQLQHFWVVPHTAPLNVNRRLLPPTTCRVFGWPVHLVQSSLWVKKAKPKEFQLQLQRVVHPPPQYSNTLKKNVSIC